MAFFHRLAELDCEVKLRAIGHLVMDFVANAGEILGIAGIAGSGRFSMKMDEQMAAVLVGNLIKNAFLYTPQGGDVSVTFSGRGFSVSNTGTAPLDKEKVFRRFYQPAGRREGATGLGLALVYSVCVNNGLDILYDFRDGRHIFEVFLKNSK